MANLHALRREQRAQGPATIMAIGTATPPNLYEQSTFPDFYFRVTNSDDKQELKKKFRRMCEKTMVKKRYLHLTEEILKERPKLCSYKEASFDDRQDIVVEEIPRLAKEAAEKAIKEWGRPKSEITHLVFCSISGIDMPGADYRLATLLGLPLTVNRLMIYSQACHMGAAMLRIAKDLAENNRGARVLVVACEITVLSFRGPNEGDFEALAFQAGFGDGAGAVVVGADPLEGIEKPIYEIAAAMQETVAESQGAVGGHLRAFGWTFYFLNQLPAIIADNLGRSLERALAPLGVREWNDVFWVAHPGNWAIIDAIEAKLQLSPDKLSTARHVFTEYGNMQSATVYFVMDELRKRSAVEGRSTTGDGLQWGVLLGFGPGLSIETVVLRSMPLHHHH
uniref:Curcumin synthase n=1 Tax=Curcuma longa TaxID=136217 RepID=UPI0001EB69B2|nr:Chain A, Curcumin synthase [Curcuma longa]3OV3_B Chain B, Curcumin synthase [Curcuma longa]3OV3_C Chain C, Curcumin synthase [Curcuma longa]3OV3_D Chain D, Curcumin synthase [Curcuma longa]